MLRLFQTGVAHMHNNGNLARQNRNPALGDLCAFGIGQRLPLARRATDKNSGRLILDGKLRQLVDAGQIETAIRIHRREARRHQSLQCHFFHSV